MGGRGLGGGDATAAGKPGQSFSPDQVITGIGIQVYFILAVSEFAFYVS